MKALIIDDERLARKELRSLLNRFHEIEIIDENTGEVVEKLIEKVSDGQIIESLRDATDKSPMQILVEEKLRNPVISTSGMVLAAVVLLQLAALFYVVFFM